MSTAKVSSSAPVRQTTSTMRLNGVKAAAPAMESASIESVGDSARSKSATDQYLTGGNDSAPVLFSADSSENQPAPSYWSAEQESQTVLTAQLDNDFSSTVDAREVEKSIETYEHAIEQIEQSAEAPVRGTRTFG